MDNPAENPLFNPSNPLIIIAQLVSYGLLLAYAVYLLRAVLKSSKEEGDEN